MARQSFSAETFATFVGLNQGYVPCEVGGVSIYDSTRCPCGKPLTMEHLGTCQRARKPEKPGERLGNSGLGSENARHNAVRDQLRDGLALLFLDATVTTRAANIDCGPPGGCPP